MLRGRGAHYIRMNYYELTYLISTDFPEEELKTFSKKISDFVLTEGGTLEKITVPIRKKLAYSIKEKKEMFLTTLNFHLNPEGLKNFEKKLKSEKQVLRYTLLKQKISKKIIPERTIKRFPKILEEISESKPFTLSKKGGVKSEDKKVGLEEIDKKIEEILKE